MTRACLSLLCLGAAGLALQPYAAATFNAAVKSTGNTFSSGSVLLSNAGTSACTAVRSGDCGTIQLSSNSAMSPGDMATGTIVITNAGTAAATMSLTASRDATTTTGFESDLNLTIYDNTTGYCLYGHSSVPFNGACDNLSGLTTNTNDPFPTSGASRGPLTAPASSPNGNNWQANEAHTLTVTVEVINNSGSVPTSAKGVLDLSWTATSVAGTSH